MILNMVLGFRYAGKHGSASGSAASKKTISKTIANTYQNQSWRRLETYRKHIEIVSNSYQNRVQIVNQRKS